MTKRDPALLRAERLRIILSMPEYKDTIGQWIEDAHNDALHRMSTAKETHDFYTAQGSYLTVKAFMDQFNQVFSRETAALEKIQRKMTKGESA